MCMCMAQMDGTSSFIYVKEKGLHMHYTRRGGGAAGGCLEG